MEIFRMRSPRRSNENLLSGLPRRNPSVTLSDHRPSSRMSSAPSSPAPENTAFNLSLSSLDAGVSSTIAEVLNRPADTLDASALSALATKAKGLQSDNRRLKTEAREAAAERAEMAMEIERLRSAMRDIVRVAEIIAIPSCGCRSQASSAPSSPAAETFSPPS